jgi:hypothetical protein
MWFWIVLAFLGLALYLSPAFTTTTGEGYERTGLPDPFFAETLASTAADANIEEPTIADRQGLVARKTVTAPFTQATLEGFDGAPAPAPVSASAPPPASASAPAPVSAPTPRSAPTSAPTSSSAPAPRSSNSGSGVSCGLRYNPYGGNYYSCDSISVPPPNLGSLPPLPDWLKAIATKTAYSNSEASLVSSWLRRNNVSANPYEFLQAVKVSQQPSGGTGTYPGGGSNFGFGYGSWQGSNFGFGTGTGTSTSTGTGNSTSTGTTDTIRTTASGKKCRPKAQTQTPQLSPADLQRLQHQIDELNKRLREQNPKQPPITMEDYIRKDSVPCWACKI